MGKKKFCLFASINNVTRGVNGKNVNKKFVATVSLLAFKRFRLNRIIQRSAKYCSLLFVQFQEKISGRKCLLTETRKEGQVEWKKIIIRFRAKVYALNCHKAHYELQ